LIYLTHKRLMLESENTVHERAVCSDEVPRRVCSQLLSDPGRYSLWHRRHDVSMIAVAAGKKRDLQILKLRAVAIQQTHRAALIRYFREHHVDELARERTLRTFYGITDPRHAAVAEHRNYLLAASSQFCALELVGDLQGVDLLRNYESAFGQYFGMFCERARAKQERAPYLLGALIPEVRHNAERLRGRILKGQFLPAQHGAHRAQPSRAAIRLHSSRS
jgi:hypothetical protein